MSGQDKPTPNFVEMITTTNGAMASGIEVVGKSAQQIADAWSRIGAEFLRFASHRLAAQAELLSGLKDCKNADELVATEQRFMDTAVDEYSQEFDRITAVARETLDVAPSARKKGSPRSVA